MLGGKRILLIIGGGIAAYKALDLTRQLRREGASVTPVLTRAAEEFVTPLSASALAAAKVYRDLFDLTVHDYDRLVQGKDLDTPFGWCSGRAQSARLSG